MAQSQLSPERLTVLDWPAPTEMLYNGGSAPSVRGDPSAPVTVPPPTMRGATHPPVDELTCREEIARVAASYDRL